MCVMTVSTWTGAISSNWAKPGNWSPAGIPGAASDVVINSGDPVAKASIGTVHSIDSSGDLFFESADANTVTTSLDNSGHLYVDHKGGEGGTSLNIGETLTNSDYLAIGSATLSKSDMMTAASLDNTGLIYLTGSGANQALLDVTGSAGFGTAGVLSGYVQLAGDSAVEFLNGQISTIAIGSQLTLDGNAAFVEDNGVGLGSNSALTGLANVAGALELENGASVSTGALADSGALYVDYSKGDGGSSLTVDGTLRNSSFFIVGNSSLSSSDSVTASSLVNTSSGLIDLTGGAGAQALLDVTAGAAGFGATRTLTGAVQLAGDSAIEFASGQIATIAGNGVLELNGKSAFIEDSGASGSNSALMGLTDVAGALEMSGDVSVTTTGALLDSGSIYLDFPGHTGGSTLSVGGAISNSGTLAVGNSLLSSSDAVTAESLVNSGTIDLIGHGANFAALNVSGATTNNGAISIASDTETLAGAVKGTGSISLSKATLLFNSSVSAGQTITETGADHLRLKQAQSFDGTISGFGTGDTIDVMNFHKSGTTFHFLENSAGTGGTLTLHDGSLTANILMTGVYSNSNFSLTHDSGTGTLVHFVA
jgi:hypothetical protein